MLATFGNIVPTRVYLYFALFAAGRLVLPATAGGAQHTETATPGVKIFYY